MKTITAKTKYQYGYNVVKIDTDANTIENVETDIELEEAIPINQALNDENIENDNIHHFIVVDHNTVV